MRRLNTWFFPTRDFRKYFAQDEGGSCEREVTVSRIPFNDQN